MILDNYTDGVVMITSMPRSGSTILGRYIGNQYNLPYAGEIFHATNLRAKEAANNAINRATERNKDFVCKYFPCDDVYDRTKLLDKKIYNVRLIRKNVARQFTSFMIATTTDRWQVHGFGKLATDQTRKEIVVDRERMDFEFDKFINSLRIDEKHGDKTQFDEVLVHEDIVDYLNENKTNNMTNIPTVQPLNYNYIYLDIIKRFKEYARKNDKHTPKRVVEWYNNFQKNGFRT